MRQIDEAHVISYVKSTMSFLDDVSNEREAYEVIHRTKGQLELLAVTEVLASEDISKLYEIFGVKREECAVRLGIEYKR